MLEKLFSRIVHWLVDNGEDVGKYVWFAVNLALIFGIPIAYGDTDESRALAVKATLAWMFVVFPVFVFIAVNVSWSKVTDRVDGLTRCKYCGRNNC